MKSNYLFLRACPEITRETVVYVVRIGQSTRERRYLYRIEREVFRQGHTFHQWSEWVDSYLSFISDELFGECVMFGHRFRTASVSAQQLLQLMDSNTFESYELNLNPHPAFFSMVNLQGKQSRLSNNRQKSNPPRQYLQRIYLSLARRSELFRVGASYAAILLLFLLAAFLEGRSGY